MCLAISERFSRLCLSLSFSAPLLFAFFFFAACFPPSVLVFSIFINVLFHIRPSRLSERACDSGASLLIRLALVSCSIHTAYAARLFPSNTPTLDINIDRLGLVRSTGYAISLLYGIGREEISPFFYGAFRARAKRRWRVISDVHEFRTTCRAPDDEALLVD